MAKCLLDNNKELINKFLECISLSLNVEQSCQACGISKVAIYSYLNKAEEVRKEAEAKGVEVDETNKFVNFSNELKKAEMSFVTRNVAIIQKASAKGSWQASAWLLERRLPKMFALRKEDEATEGKKEMSVKVIFEKGKNETDEEALEEQVRKELK